MRKADEAGAPRRGRGRGREASAEATAAALPPPVASLGCFWYRRWDLSTQPRKASVAKTQNKTNAPTPQTKQKPQPSSLQFILNILKTPQACPPPGRDPRGEPLREAR